MATLAYAIRTEQREKAPSKTSKKKSPPGSTTWIDAVAALVPAEVLAAHAFFITLATETTEGDDGQHVTTITDPAALKIAFWGLIVVPAILYVLKKAKTFDRTWDVVRMLLPPSAFVLWAMLTPSSAFDAQFPDVSHTVRVVIAVLGAVVIAAVAKKLGEVADGK